MKTDSLRMIVRFLTLLINGCRKDAGVAASLKGWGLFLYKGIWNIRDKRGIVVVASLWTVANTHEWLGLRCA